MHQAAVASHAMFPLVPRRRADTRRGEALHVMRKGQVKRLAGRVSVGQAQFVASLFGVAA